MRYQDLKEGIESRLNAAAEDFFTIGYYLRQISDEALFIQDGYKSIWEFAKGEYNLSTASASRFMAINAKFSIDGGQTMEQRYIGMGVSKLQEMLTLPEEDLEKVTKETTVKEIRAMKAAAKPQLSYFGFPITQRPEGSLLTTKGCSRNGDGKGGHDCFTCCHDCAIRQEPRQCYTATVGNPHPCNFTQEDRETVAKCTIHGDKCLHLHPELAPTRAGDNEPVPCCLLCEEWKSHSCNMACCDVAKKKNEEKRREYERQREQARRELKKAAKEKEKAAEATRRGIRESEYRKLYKWLDIATWEEITAAGLRDRHGKAHKGGGNSEFGYSCSPRGVRINDSKEETWTQAARILREIQKEEQKKHPKQEETPDIIDAEFTEIEAEPAEEAQPEEMTGARAAFEKARAKLSATQGPTETPEAEADPEQEKPWAKYRLIDVKAILEKQRFDLKEYEGLQEQAKNEREMLPESTLRKAQILVDALQMLFDRMEEQEAEDNDEEED